MVVKRIQMRKGGDQLKTWQKALFILVLVVFVAVSVTISLISLSRPPYQYKEETAVGGNEALNGWVFTAFNGNVETVKLSIDVVRDRNGDAPDETRPVVAVRAFAVNADEYVEELFIGASVQSIDDKAFYNLKKLQRITVDPANEFYKDVDGVLFSRDGSKLLLYPACYGQTPTEQEGEYSYPDDYRVPEGVEQIGSFAFLKNEHLRDVTLPVSLRVIGDMAFFGCSRLGAYEYDEAAGSLVGAGFALPDGVETLGADVFSKCVSIAPCFYLPASVKEIGNNAFFACTGMKEMLLGAPDESGLTLGASWLPKSIKAGAMWKAPQPQFGRTRADSDSLIEAYKAEQLERSREEAQANG